MPTGIYKHKTGFYLTDKWKKNISDSNLGKVCSEYTKSRISLALKGKPLSLEHKKKLSISNKGKSRNVKEKNPNWVGGIIKNPAGYILVYSPNHPHTSSQKYVLQHRLVVEKNLGRYLEPYEQIHHKNRIKDDNRIENLEILTASEHTKQRIKIKCPFCLKEFLIKG